MTRCSLIFHHRLGWPYYLYGYLSLSLGVTNTEITRVISDQQITSPSQHKALLSLLQIISRLDCMFFSELKTCDKVTRLHNRVWPRGLLTNSDPKENGGWMDGWMEAKIQFFIQTSLDRGLGTHLAIRAKEYAEESDDVTHKILLTLFLVPLPHTFSFSALIFLQSTFFTQFPLPLSLSGVCIIKIWLASRQEPATQRESSI